MSSTFNQQIDVEESSTSIRLKWEQLSDVESYFEIKFKEKNEPKFSVKNIKQIVENEIDLCNLKSNMIYLIKGSIITDEGGHTPIFDISCKTKPSVIPALINESTLVWTKPTIYKLPCVVREFERDCLRECYIGVKNGQPKITEDSNAKTILVVGATGAGKSTLIEAMINHIVDVSFRDECRFKMVDLTTKEETSKDEQTLSQTSTTTCYRIPRREGFSIDFPINIIDTPGFDDTRGKSFDKQIPIQIRKLFESVIQRLHAVCIVVPLSSTRLTEAQKWVFQNILSLFGANIKHIIYSCITHDDGGDTKCLSALKAAEIPYKDFFRFNNSDLFAQTQSENVWNKRKTNFDKLFFEIANVQPQCLKSSEEVLRARQKKSIQLENFRRKIRNQVQYVNTIKETEDFLRKCESEKESNKHFTFDECVSKKVKSKSKKRSVNCTVCQESCHKKCNVPFDIFLSFCEVFTNGKCTSCKPECSPDKHERQYIEYDTIFVKEQKTKSDIEKKYKDAVEGTIQHKREVEIEKWRLLQSLQELKDILLDVKKLITSLNEIALQREHFSDEMFYDEVIELENVKKEYDYEIRIRFLNKIKNAMKDNTPLEELMREMSEY